MGVYDRCNELVSDALGDFAITLSHMIDELGGKK